MNAAHTTLFAPNSRRMNLWRMLRRRYLRRDAVSRNRRIFGQIRPKSPYSNQVTLGSILARNSMAFS
jgi:hypothetical protein